MASNLNLQPARNRPHRYNSSQVLTSAVSSNSYPLARKEPLQARQRAAACEAALVAALAGLAPVARRVRAGGAGAEGADKVGLGLDG